MTNTAPQSRTQAGPDAGRPRRWGRITRVEWVAAAAAAVVMGGLVLAEPDILGAPVENGRTLAFTLGGTAAAAVALLL
jgi:hypothetical protein